MMKLKNVLIFCAASFLFVGCGRVDEVSQKVMDDIDSLGEITVEDAEKIEKILSLYETLTEEAMK